MTPLSSDFVHLHVHTQYSLLDGAIRLDRLLKRVSDFGMEAVAITDHGTMFGVVEFYEKALAAGIKPIIGCEFYVAPRSLNDKTPIDSKGASHLVLLAENQEGYRNLCKLASIAQLKGFYYKPRIDKEVLKEHSKGLIGLSACLHGEIPALIKDGHIKQADDVARFYVNILGENNFFLEVQNNGIDVQEEVNAVLLDMSCRLSIPLVASNDCHYLEKGDAYAHEVLLCIQTGTTIQNPNRFKFRTDQLYFKSTDEMRGAFSHYPGALEHSVDIANRCGIEFDFNTYHFPKYSAKADVLPDEIFERETRKGYGDRLKKVKENNPAVDEKIYHERLNYEIQMIKEMGFTGYFLIVADFIRYAKDNKIPVGPGRGSAAGSIVAYSLGITDLDPIANGLIFERFLNPARKSMPDIDVDFCINGREQVFKYVVERYGGGDYVAQIITFGKMKTRAVIRDVGRALDIPLNEVDAIAKMVPDVLNITLDDALEKEPKLKELATQKPGVADLINICRILEGLPRHASTHAAGVVIGDKPLVEYLPLYKGKNDEVVTQYDMKRVEKIGLVKFDFLGLRNLTVIASALDLIARQGKMPPDIINLDLNDSNTYRLLSSGDTTGVFQLESSGMKDLLIRMKPENFNDITALVALYRPGPMESGMHDDYVERKHGRKKVEYLVPELEPILKETYGVIVYQEQVMQIAGKLATYTMSEADDLRKAMGKKIPEIMARHRERFMQGAQEMKIPSDKAKKIFDWIEKFGGYGFNKSHSAAYALIAYQTAFLKTHFSVEFMAALLTSEMNSTDNIVKYIAECRNHDIPILPPDINESEKEFAVNGSTIRFGLVAVKNVGENAIDSIIEARRDGKFSSLFDFCERVSLKKVNKRVIESLIKSGAFDSAGNTRSEMMIALEDALDYGQKIQRERMDPQMGLFDMGDSQKPAINAPAIVKMDEWDEKQRLLFEKESLGFYISGHPLDRYKEILEKFTDTDTVTMKEINQSTAVRIGGVVRNPKIIKTKKGDTMAFILLEDLHGSVEVVIFPSLFESVSDLLTDDTIVLVQGEARQEEKGVKVLADTIIPVEKAEETWTATIHIRIETDRVEKKLLMELYDVLKMHPGSCKCQIHLLIPEESETIIDLPDEMKLKAGSILKRKVNGLLNYDAVYTTCTTAADAMKNNPSRRSPRNGKCNY